MTPKQALSLQNKIAKSGLKLSLAGLGFHKLVRNFRMSGAWAITQEHHASFRAWCTWFAPQIKMAAATLCGYGAPNYKDRYTRIQERNIKAGLLNMHSLNVSGLPAKWMQKAIDRAHENGITEQRRGGTERAIIHIAKTFLEIKIKLNRAA